MFKYKRVLYNTMKRTLIIAMLIAVVLASGCTGPDGNGDGGTDGTNGAQPDGGNGQNGGQVAPEGMSYETAIVIEAGNEDEGIGMEYDYLYANSCADNGGSVDLLMQELGEYDGHTFDLMTVLCADGSEETWYFQIDSFFGKWE